MAPEDGHIFPRNLTARAAHRIAGNPDSSRPEDAVGNCYPGLESDNRNLDRRFFPGLIFNFVARTDTDAPWTEPMRYGAQLAYTDEHSDPDLQPFVVAAMDESVRRWIAPLAADLLSQLTGDVGAMLADGTWHLDWIEQGGRRIDLMQVLPDGQAAGLDGLFVWRLVRGLEPMPVTIALRQRTTDRPPVILKGWRRLFTDPRTGVISEAYQPGELTQALCSPWQHDFRDCNCHYWPANRPDIVHVAVPEGAPVLPDGRSVDPLAATLRVDWMRAERDTAVAASVFDRVAPNRPYQMDYYQINRTWTELAVVLNNTEIGETWTPAAPHTAEPYASPEELAAVLRDLAPVEMTLAVEYLYARWSLLSEQDAAATGIPGLGDDVLFARHILLLTAVNEMQHLRWANEMLWSLHAAGLIADYAPLLDPSAMVPSRPEPRPRALRMLTPETLADFIGIEHPQGTIEADYTRIAVTLQKPIYPRHLNELASRIVNGGLDHYTQLREVQAVLRSYDGAGPAPYLRALTPATPADAAAALAAYDSIRTHMRVGYAAMARGAAAEAGREIAAGRTAMDALLANGEALAVTGLGVPFW